MFSTAKICAKTSSQIKNKQALEVTTTQYEMEIGMAERAENKQKSIIFTVVPQIKVEKQI